MQVNPRVLTGFLGLVRGMLPFGLSIFLGHPKHWMEI